MLRTTLPRLALLPLLVVASCAQTGEPRPALDEAVRPPEPLCHIEGTWTVGDLRTPKAEVRYANVWNARAEGDLVDADGKPRLLLRLERGGWRLSGVVDPREDEGLRAKGPVWLGEVAAVASGAGLRVLAAAPGKAKVGLPRFAFEEKDGYRFLEAPEGWVSCEALGFAFTFRDKDTARKERVELGFPEELPLRYLPAETKATLAASPEGQPHVEIGARKYPITVRLLEEKGGAARVLI